MVVGNNVAKCFAEINKLSAHSEQNTAAKAKAKRRPVADALDFIAGCMTQLIPVIIAGGLIKALLAVFGENCLNLLSASSDTYVIFNAIGDAAFYFLPIFVALSASKKLGCNSFLAMMLGAMLIHPGIISLLGGEAPTSLFGFIPVVHGSYSASVIPAMLCSNIAQGAVCFGAAFAAKDKKLRQVAFPAGTSALLAGVTEPALYGVTLKRRIYMAAAMIAGGIGGFILGIVGVRTYALASPCITSIIQFVAPDDRTNLLFACVSAAVSFVVAFVLSFIFTRTARNESLSEKTGE